PVVFLPRHDKGHRLPPSDINYRANIDVLKRAGVTDLVSLSACGSFKEESETDRKSTRLNSSHVSISYAVFCLKKKNNKNECRVIIVTDQVQSFRMALCGVHTASSSSTL